MGAAEGGRGWGLVDRAGALVARRNCRNSRVFCVKERSPPVVLCNFTAATTRNEAFPAIYRVSFLFLGEEDLGEMS